jgi:ribonuclease VapC
VTSVVLDASALLAVVNDEPGADMVHASLLNAVISAVNYSEVWKKAIENGVAIEPFLSLIQAASLDIVPFDTILAEASAALYPHTKAQGLSFADRACLALGIHRGATVLTADSKWKRLNLSSLKVKVIRNAH